MGCLSVDCDPLFRDEISEKDTSLSRDLQDAFVGLIAMPGQLKNQGSAKLIVHELGE